MVETRFDDGLLQILNTPAGTHAGIRAAGPRGGTRRTGACAELFAAGGKPDGWEGPGEGDIGRARSIAATTAGACVRKGQALGNKFPQAPRRIAPSAVHKEFRIRRSVVRLEGHRDRGRGGVGTHQDAPGPRVDLGKRARMGG